METLMTLEIRHEWFTSGRFAACQVVPAPKTAQLLERYRLLSELRDGVYTLFCSGQTGCASVLTSLQAQLFGEPLQFSLRHRPHEFAAITELAVDWVGTLAFDTRRTENRAGALRLLPELRATVPVLGQPVASTSAMSHAEIATLALYPAQLVSGAGVGSGSAPHYVIAFAARRLHWMYWLHYRGHTRLNRPQITDLKGIEFEPPQALTLPDGTAALCFGSGDLSFPMQQVPEQRLQLIDHMAVPSAPPVRRCVMRGLPTPQPGQIKQQIRSGQPYVFSAMHLYL